MNETLFAQPLEQKIVLQKVVKSRLGISGCGVTKLVDRDVVIRTDADLGYCICIRSKDGVSQKPKNMIPVFINNPLNYTNIMINREEYDAIYINRGEKDKPVILTSKNNLLMRIFCNEIENTVKKLNSVAIHSIYGPIVYKLSSLNVYILSKTKKYFKIR